MFVFEWKECLKENKNIKINNPKVKLENSIKNHIRSAPNKNENK